MTKIIKTLWHGDVPLWKTFWAYFLLPLFLLQLPIERMTTELQTSPQLILYAGLVCFYGVFVLTFMVFMWVSVWRAGSKYRGLYLWKTLALATVVFQAIFAALQVLGTIKSLS